MNYPTHPNYDQLHNGCITFSQFMVKPPDVIVGLIRGGMFNAVLLSHIYGDVPIIALDYSSSAGKGDNSDSHTNVIPELPHRFGELPGLKRVLLVDDICDSGYTMKEIAEVYENRGHVVRSYVSFLKSSAEFQPTGWTYLIPENAPWIIFPWEDV